MEAAFIKKKYDVTNNLSIKTVTVRIYRRIGLPDDYALCLGTEHLVAFLDAESLEEGSDVLQRYVHTIVAQRVNVAGCE